MNIGVVYLKLLIDVLKDYSGSVVQKLMLKVSSHHICNAVKLACLEEGEKKVSCCFVLAGSLADALIAVCWEKTP